MRNHHSVLLRLSLALAALIALPAAPIGATTTPACSQPVSTGAMPVASDCLFILNAAVGLQTCGCECDPSGDSKTTATDALTCLNVAVGVDLPLACPCGGTTTTTTTTTTSTTTTTTSTTTTTMGGGGGPLDPRDLIGLVTASRDRNISSVEFPAGVALSIGTGLPIEEGFSLAAGFGILEDLGEDPNTTITTEEIGGCSVTTIEQITELSGFGVIPSFTPLDAGNSGTASNGSVQLELLSVGFGGYETTEDPLAAGFDGGQTVQFSWPGGSDIDAFSDSIVVPPTVVVNTPDLTDPSFDLVPGQAIAVSWVPGPDQDGNITITVSTSTSETTFDGMSITMENISVFVDCMFADNSGSGSVPAAATSRLQSMAPLGGSLSKLFSAARQNQKAVSVSAPNVAGDDLVGFFGLSSITRSISAGFGFP